MGGGSSAEFPLMYWRGRWCEKGSESGKHHGVEATGETILTAASAAALLR
jgi:hypothetical protein